MNETVKTEERILVPDDVSGTHLVNEIMALTLEERMELLAYLKRQGYIPKEGM